MKHILFIGLFLAQSGLLFAQKIVEKTYKLPASQKVVMNLKFADNIKLKVWDKKEVGIKATVLINNGQLDEAFQFEAKEGETLELKSSVDEKSLQNAVAIECPEGQKIFWGKHENGKNNGVCMKIDFEIFVPKNAQVELETINGNIEIRDFFNTIYAKTISGFVDADWASSKGADLELKTITGELYSDLEIEFLNKKKSGSPVGYELKGQYQNGGVRVHLESISGDVYLRKK